MGSLRHNAEIHGIIVTAQPPAESVAPASTPPPQPERQLPPRTLPLGPLTIDKIADHQDGIAVTLAQFADIRVGDTVLVAATGSTSINGVWSVIAVNGPLVVIDTSYVLAAPIVAKGRLTVTA